jgi:hypothetical protein
LFSQFLNKNFKLSFALLHLQVKLKIPGNMIFIKNKVRITGGFLNFPAANIASENARHLIYESRAETKAVSAPAKRAFDRGRWKEIYWLNSNSATGLIPFTACPGIEFRSDGLSHAEK